MHSLSNKWLLISLSFCVLILFSYASSTIADVRQLLVLSDTKLSTEQSRVIFLTRHFEKEIILQQSPIANAPVDSHKDPRLTKQGQKRALALASYLKDHNITAVFSTNYQRTMQTAKPTADEFGLAILQYNPSDLVSFASGLLRKPRKPQGNILIVGHSNTTPQLLKLLGGPDKTLGESDYGDLFMLEFETVDGIVKQTHQHALIEPL